MISPIKDTFLKRNGKKVSPRRKTDWFLLNQAKPYSIGDPYSPGFGLGVVSPDMVPPGIIPYYGTYDALHPEYGHYYHAATGSDLCCIVPFWIKLNPTKDPPVLVKDFDQYSSAAEASADGYYMPRGFYDGGEIKPFFLDTYVNSKTALGTGYVAASKRFGNPISTHADHNPIADLTACDSNYYYQAIIAPKARDGENGAVNPESIWYCPTKAQFAIIQLLSLSIPKDSPFCAWRNATDTYHWPKGCNNNSLGADGDSSLVFVSDGFPNCSQAGSGNQYAKTTHNGSNGVCDISGPMYNIASGMTQDVTSKSIEAIALGEVTTITVSGHGMTENGVVHIYGIEGTTELNEKLYDATVVDPDTLTIPVDSTLFGAYTSGGTLLYSTFRALKTTASPVDQTSGTSEDTDIFYPESSLFESYEMAFATTYPNNGYGQRYGNGSNAVFDFTKTRGLLGFPEATGISTTGADKYGKDYFYQYFRNQCVPILFGPWSYSSYAGVSYVHLYDARSSSSTYVGCRCACSGLYGL
jgi:hypothetical protein